MPPTSVSIIGIGKLGAPIAACLAAKGLRVVAVDSDPGKVEAIQRLEAPVFEPGLAEMLAQTGGRLTATNDATDAVLRTGVTFIIVPTPSEPDGGFSLRFVLPVCRAIGQALRVKPRRHTVVLSSTVMPGDTGGAVRSMLEEASGKRAGADFGLCYSPEFIALGSVIRDYLHPDFILIGESDSEAGELLESIYGQVCENQPAVARMGFTDAELAKIAVNSFITTKITFANMLAGICQNLPGANVDKVTAALGLDSRIGRKYLKGGVGYGGPCFPRDNVALAALARKVGARADVAAAVDRANREFIPRLAALVRWHTPAAGVVGVLGLSYKPQTDVVEQSQGMLLAAALSEAGVDVIAHDPAAMGNAAKALPARVGFAADVNACVAAADTLVVVTPWPQYGEPLAAALRASSKRHTVVDCWRMLDAAALGPATEHLALGKGPDAGSIQVKESAEPTDKPRAPEVRVCAPQPLPGGAMARGGR